jgi:hypothetical protein
VRLEVTAESDVPRILALAVRHAGKIVSLNPVKMSLEDYFLAQTGTTPNASPRGDATTVRASAREEQ